MYNQNSLATGAKWFVFLAMVILLGAVALGDNIKDAKWWNREIASAIANQMNVATDIERQKAELELQVLRTQTEIQVAEMKRQAEYEAAKQQQEFEAAAIAEAQKAEFRSGFYNTLNAGLMVLLVAVGIVVTVAGVNASLGLRTTKINTAEAYQLNKASAPISAVNHRQPSLAAQQARLREQADRRSILRAERVNRMLKNTEVVWSAEEKNSTKYSAGNDSLAS
ncbi:MAG: hypothetical protein OHK003_32190 [Anaerolineales bacterium]